MGGEQPCVSVLIVTWNGKSYTLECLNSLRDNVHGVEISAVVVDNDSVDGTVEAIRHQFPDVTVIQSGANLGFAKGNNIGMRHVICSPYLCLLNSDVVVPKGCFERIIAYMEANVDVGMVGPKMLSPDGGIGQSVMLFPTLWNSLCCALCLHSLLKTSRLFGGYMMNWFSYNTITDVEVLTGWFWVVRTAAVQEVGGLDERFFMYGEDIDWCYRFHKAGWRTVFYPEAHALHYAAASSAAAPVRFYIEMRRANLQYFRKHRGWRGYWGYWLVLVVHEMIRFLGYGIIYALNSSKRATSRDKLITTSQCLRWLAGMKIEPLKANN